MWNKIAAVAITAAVLGFSRTGKRADVWGLVGRSLPDL
jgi:flagellar basal body P-ring protein FlgI